MAILDASGDEPVNAHAALAVARQITWEIIVQRLYIDRYSKAEIEQIGQEIMAAFDAAPIADSNGMEGDWVKHQCLHAIENFFSSAARKKDAQQR